MDVERLVTDNIGLAGFIAKKYPTYEYDEMFGYACIGLVRAAQTFDESKNIKFATYAIRCITNEIGMALRKNKKQVSVVTSLDAPVATVDVPLSEMIADEFCMEERSESLAMYRAVLQYIDSLPTQRKYILQAHYGLGYPPLTQAQIAAATNLSQSYISRIIAQEEAEMKTRIGVDFS